MHFRFGKPPGVLVVSYTIKKIGSAMIAPPISIPRDAVLNY
jgi:hypothetical protein